MQSRSHHRGNQSDWREAAEVPMAGLLQGLVAGDIFP